MDISNIISALRNKISGPPAGTIAGAARSLDNRAYQMHVQEAQALGQAPLSPAAFAAQATRAPQLSQVPPNGLLPQQ